MRYRIGSIFSHFFLTAIQIVALVFLDKLSWFHNYIGVFIIISIVINIFLFVRYYSIAKMNDKRFGKKRLKKESVYKSPVYQMEINTIDIIDKSSFYNDIATAKYSDGKVYCKGMTTYLIGHYIMKKNKVLVTAKDHREIGTINLKNGIPGLITLSNLGWYKHMGITDYSLKPTALPAAEIYYFEEKRNQQQVILDIKSSDVIATYRGDPVGAAASFICMQYECSQSGKYHEFYHGNSIKHKKLQLFLI